MKFTPEELDTIMKFIGIMKRRDPGGEWKITLSDVMYDPDAPVFTPLIHIYINGKKVEGKP